MTTLDHNHNPYMELLKAQTLFMTSPLLNPSVETPKTKSRLYIVTPPQTPYDKYAHIIAQSGNCCVYMDKLRLQDKEYFNKDGGCKECLANIGPKISNLTLKEKKEMELTGVRDYCKWCPFCSIYKKRLDNEEKTRINEEIRTKANNLKAHTEPHCAIIEQNPLIKYYFTTITHPNTSDTHENIITSLIEKALKILKSSQLTFLSHYGVIELTEIGTPHLHILFKAHLKLNKKGKPAHVSATCPTFHTKNDNTIRTDLLKLNGPNSVKEKLESYMTKAPYYIPPQLTLNFETMYLQN